MMSPQRSSVPSRPSAAPLSSRAMTVMAMTAAGLMIAAGLFGAPVADGHASGATGASSLPAMMRLDDDGVTGAAGNSGIFGAASWGDSAGDQGRYKHGERAILEVDEEGGKSRQQISAGVLLPIVIILLVCGAMATLTYATGSAFISESSCALLVGIVASAIFKAVDYDYYAPIFRFNPSIFFVGYLPPLMFWGGYQVNKYAFFSEVCTILVYAIIGVSITIAFVGPLLWLSGVGDYTLFESLTYASLIAATDPVCALAVFEKQGIEPRFFTILFGEALLNDAIAMVYYDLFASFVEEGYSAQKIYAMIGLFILNSWGACFLGCVIAFIGILVVKYTTHATYPQGQVMVVLVICEASFFVADALHMSGIISSFCAGIFTAMYIGPHLSEAGDMLTHSFFDMLTRLLDLATFFALGTALLLNGMTWNWRLCFTILGLCLAGRAINIFGLSIPINACTHADAAPVSFSEQFLIYFAGIRGAIAFSAVVDFPGDQGVKKTDLIGATSFMLLLGIFVFGTLTFPLMKILKIRCGLKEGEAGIYPQQDHPRWKLFLRQHIDQELFDNWLLQGSRIIGKSGEL